MKKHFTGTCTIAPGVRERGSAPFCTDAPWGPVLSLTGMPEVNPRVLTSDQIKLRA